jgi:hypothetical protein
MTRIGRIIADFTSFLRKLKHTVNKVPSLRDLAWSGGDRHRTLKRAVNKVSPLWGFTGNRQASRINKPRRGNTLLTGCFSFRLWQPSRISKPRRGDTLLTARFNVRKKELSIVNYQLSIINNNYNENKNFSIISSACFER